MAVPDPRPQGGRGCSSPSGQGVLRTVHLLISLVSEQMAWSPPGAWSTLRVRSSEPLRKPQRLFFLEQGPHGDHSLISQCAGRKRGKERKEEKGSHLFLWPRTPQGSFSHLLSAWGSGPEGRKALRETPERGGGGGGVSFLWTAPSAHSLATLLLGSWTLCPQCPWCLTRTAALCGAIGSCRALGTVWVAAALVQV